MKHSTIVYLVAGTIIFIGIYTKTPYIRNFINKIRQQATTGWKTKQEAEGIQYDWNKEHPGTLLPKYPAVRGSGSGSGSGNPDYSVYEPKPGQHARFFPNIEVGFGYDDDYYYGYEDASPDSPYSLYKRNLVGGGPGKDESLEPLTKEQADWYKHHTPLPPLTGETPEEQIKRTRQQEQKKKQKQEKAHRNTIPRQSSSSPYSPSQIPDPGVVVPALGPYPDADMTPDYTSTYDPTSMTPTSTPIESQNPWIGPITPEPHRQPEIGPITPEPHRQPEIGPITPEPHRQPEIGPTVPEPYRQPQIGPTTQGRAVGSSHPATGDYHGQKIDVNGCYEGKRSNDTLFTCRAGIGTGPDGRPVYEAGKMTTKVSDLLGGSRNFHLVYHFVLGSPSSKSGYFAKGKSGGGGGDKGSTSEVTAGYDGSSSDETATGITIGIRNGNGDVMARTEDHNDSHNVPGEYRELCKEGSGASCGGVSRIPEFSAENGGAYGKEFDIIWVGSQIPGGVNYKGYVRVTRTGNTYLIVNLNNPKTGGMPGAGSHAIGGGNVINYLTQHNYFCRGRSDGAGSVQIHGILYADGDGTYNPGPNVITSDQQQRGYYYDYYEDPSYYYDYYS